MDVDVEYFCGLCPEYDMSCGVLKDSLVCG